MSCTSKWRWPSTRQAASRTVAKASMSRSSRISPLAIALAEVHRPVGQVVVGQRLDLGLELVDEGDELRQPADLLALAGPQDARERRS